MTAGLPTPRARKGGGYGGDGDRVAEDLGPGAEWLVGADGQRGTFVAGGHQGVEEGGGFGLEGDVSDFVADQQRDAAQPVELGVEAAGSARLRGAARRFGRGRWKQF